MKVIAPKRLITSNLSSIRNRAFDSEALNYIQRVEAADGQPLEDTIKIAIDRFVRGCKTDGIWNAIKASCILAGARTLNGALVPLAGTAPTNFNFVSGDYNRKTGLVGNGSTKYLNSNRACNLDGINNYHQSVYISSTNSIASSFSHNYVGAIEGTQIRGLVTISSTLTHGVLSNSSTISPVGSPPLKTGLFAQSRASSLLCVVREGLASTAVTDSLGTADISANTFVFQRGDGRFVNARLAFYSIGESLDLALLDARVTDLINAFGAAIP